VPDGLGFMLQNRGELFSLEDGHPNQYAPGKRPFQTIIPGFVMKDGRPWMAFGVMGGDMQPQGHVQVLANTIDFGMNVQEAGDAARFRHGQGYFASETADPVYGELQMESGIAPEVRAELVRRGHVMAGGPGGFGGYQAILRDETNGVYHAASESRKDGAAIGY
jgi:gamma-glutamyltranspeptidase/glutathione hydrolase